MVITNGRIITQKEILSGYSLQTRDGKIVRIAPASSIQASSEEPVIDAKGCFVSPGFIDIHIHGAVGCDTMDASLESIAKITRYHASGGTTALVLTTISAPSETILKAIQVVADARTHDFGGAQILGVHLEGPYFAPTMRGAHDPKQIRNPNPDEYNAWLEFDDVITQMTLAPELDGSPDLVEKLASHEIIPSGGHTDTDEDAVLRAIDRGLCHATHLFNAMSTIRKRGPFRYCGMLEVALANDSVTVELIADGKHVPPTAMKMAIRAKGVDRVCLVTDATAGAGMPQGTQFSLGETTAVVGDGVCLAPDGKHLAGSSSQTINLVKTIVESVGMPIVDAVRMASLTPARVLGISGRKGSLEERKDADLVIFDSDFQVHHTIIGGKVIYPQIFKRKEREQQHF